MPGFPFQLFADQAEHQCQLNGLSDFPRHLARLHQQNLCIRRGIRDKSKPTLFWQCVSALLLLLLSSLKSTNSLFRADNVSGRHHSERTIADWIGAVVGSRLSLLDRFMDDSATFGDSVSTEYD
jgi:hypothetical protein